MHSGSITNLGFHFDSQLSMENHISKTCASVHYHLKQISKVRDLINADTCKLLVHSFVTSRLDYCNSLLSGTSANQISRLQKLQNRAAPLITRTKQREHITPILKSLHWLPIESRIQFKILCFVFKVRSSSAPEYISELLQSHCPSRTLRSQSLGYYTVPNMSSHFRTKSFSYSAPKLWNALPIEIKNCKTLGEFKKKLKTYLFSRVYNC